MKLNCPFLCQCAAVVIAIFAHPAFAVEPWADKKLSVTNGLALWLDAGKEIDARRQSSSKNSRGESIKISNGGLLDRWHDASGNQRHVYQPVPTARPRFVQHSGGAAIRFDGADDFFSAAGLREDLDEVTIFILTAPHANKKEFGAFLALNRDGANDYSSGLNVDMGQGAKKKFDFVNVEGAGFVGVQDLMTSSAPFDEARILSISAQPGTNGARLYVDGVAQEIFGRNTTPHKSRRAQRRQQDAEFFAFDQITIGARFFSNAAEPPHVQGFFEGDLLEVLIYDRVLGDSERLEVENYLKRKLVSKIAGRALVPLIQVTNPAPVQMFLPGFSARELPVAMNNVNCVKYREDGRLVALTYDGNLWLLSDTDGDGIEDKVSAFWTNRPMRSPIGMALTPPNYPKGRGVFVASKDRVSLIVDTNNDHYADEELIVANGWGESFHNVDALGCAVDQEGNVYFGLGTANFADGYMVDKASGKSTYDLKGERTTIMKVSPDFKTREVISTGIRFPVALAFNASGDLFCSDQEGATWLPNGNPFDELLHIEKGKHYGFPPRHPKHLPNVIDEPSVFDYAPQHQCTCGINFNEPVNGGPIFGPSSWRGDVFVAGYSRGKLYRTKLVKSAAGYVAQNQIIASLSMLPPDICVSPQGDLVVPVHSGKPDWGSGPTGAGKIYKIFYSDKQAPQPLAIWPPSSTETAIEFNRALTADEAKSLTKNISITQGKYVGAGDPFETIRPGYQVVQNQMLEPRYVVKVLSTALSPDGRLLTIRTESRNEAVNYAVSFSRGSQPESAQNKKELRQEPTLELAHDLTGVEATFTANGKQKSIWLPHLDTQVAAELAQSDEAQSELWSLGVSGPAVVGLRTQLDLWQMLRAATQPGSELDFKYPDETVTVVLKSKYPLAANAAGMKAQQISANEIHLTATPKQGEWFPLEVTLSVPSRMSANLEVAWFTAEDSRQRALPLRRLFVPWALPQRNGDDKRIEKNIPEIAGGNWLSGKKIFLSEQAACYKCHVFGNDGTKIGPDLSNLVHRDYASVFKDIVDPNAAINPDHISYNVELKDGETLSGVVVGSNETETRLADASGKITTIPKSQIASMKPSTLSLMPEGLIEPLSEQQRKDLLTYLLMPQPLEPAPLEKEGEPSPRKLSEVEALLNRSSRGDSAQTSAGQNENQSRLTSAATRVLKIVFCSGPKDHGPGEHDYPLWQKRWSKLLALAENVSVETADVWPSAEQMAKGDVIVFYSNNPGWSPERARELDQFLNRGGGAVYIHYAVDGHKHCDELAQRIGLAWRGGASKFRHGALDLKFQPHPISEGFSSASFIDESYWQLIGSETNIQLLASGIEEGKPQPLMWTREQGKGRVFVSIPGHYNWTFDDPLFRLLIFRGISWSAHDSLERFDDLSTIGARVSE